MFYDVADTDGFTVDRDGYLVVNNTHVFDSIQEIEFYVRKHNSLVMIMMHDKLLLFPDTEQIITINTMTPH